MKIKATAFLLACLCTLAFASSCGSDKTGNISSGVTESEQLVIGTTSGFDNEFPNYNESQNFSDVSAELESFVVSSDISSKDSSSKKSSSSKKPSSTSSKKASSVTTTSSVPTSSENSSQQTTTAPSTSSTVSSGNKTVNYDTVKAVWISYIDFANIMTNKTESAFRANFEKVCKNASDFGLNTLVCQVRAFGDAAYPSEYFAWSQMVSGVGKNPGYDPLKIMVELSHKYNLSFHAWINPFRTFLNTQVSKVPSSAIFKKWYNDSSKNGRYIVKVGERWYYNPGEPEVRELILNGVNEILNNYSVDGIHFDDYFYPTTDASFDSASYSRYGNGKILAAFRKNNVSTLVKSVYNTVKKINSNIVFGISPDANVDNDMNKLYADVKLWCSTNGYIDYICPQDYYNYDSESTSFTKALNTWNSMVTASNVKLMVGLAPYKIGYKEDYWACTSANREKHKLSPDGCGAYGWQTKDAASSNILARQYADSMALKKCGGVFLYSYQYVFNVEGYFSNSSTYTDNAVAQAKTEMQKLKQELKQ
ncbi:MAG: family 10 glycosylhydrolase [Oscillospiraceae bacterium]|nr:family 10 glycosylhydrolase [Oscillospiraceae bacterium]